jgi:hypothetical protein
MTFIVLYFRSPVSRFCAALFCIYFSVYNKFYVIYITFTIHQTICFAQLQDVFSCTLVLFLISVYKGVVRHNTASSDGQSNSYWSAQSRAL